jgi:hypothetical protein
MYIVMEREIVVQSEEETASTIYNAGMIMSNPRTNCPGSHTTDCHKMIVKTEKFK